MVDQIMAATRFGLEYERLRIEAASHNIAVANTPSAAGATSSLLAVSAPFSAHTHDASPTVGHPVLVERGADERKVHDPSDPAADQSGMVSYPKVDLVGEMSTLISAGSAYEANVRAFNALRSMDLHALDIGGGA